jgi:hypothetical protein
MTDVEHRVPREAAHVFIEIDPEIAQSWGDRQLRQVGPRPIGRECANGST